MLMTVRYASYVGFFLGMGLISGSIVHMPLEPSRYATLMLIGILLFVAASFVTEVYLEQKDMTPLQTIRSLLLSLCLSVGVGMMSGGIQHFADNMEYSATLIPLGFGISLFSFVFKQGVRLNTRQLTALVGIFLALAIPLRASLDYVASYVPVTVHGDGHGHSH